MNKIVTHVAVGVAGLGVGIGVGYLLGKRHLAEIVAANRQIDEQYWLERLNEAEGPAAIITTGEPIQTADTPIYDEVMTESTPVPAVVDQASEMMGEPEQEELPPDFPDAPVVVADDFTVEGQPAPVDAREFVERFKNRAMGDFGGVTFPGQADPESLDADQPDIPVKTVPDFVTVRDPNGPYVISIDDFMDPETDPPFTKVEMRWFSGDNVVVDARDDQVPMSTVGQHNTLRFGEGTTDPEQVYIRNERLSIDIELTREPGMYLHEVLGQDFPDKSPILRMRGADDD